MARTASPRRILNRNYPYSISTTAGTDKIWSTSNTGISADHAMTMGGWFKFTVLNAGTSSTAISVGVQSTDNMWNIGITGANLIIGSLYNRCNATSAVTAVANTWYHIVLAYAGGTAPLRLYINGALSVTTTNVTTANVTNTPFCIAMTSDSGKKQTGEFADCFVTNTDTSDAEVMNIYKGYYTAKPQIRWKFSEGTGTTATDTGTSANNGVITGSLWVADSPMKARTAAGARTAAIQSQNLWLHSGDFSTGWTLSDFPITVTDQGAGTAPDGTGHAWLFTSSGGGTKHRALQTLNSASRQRQVTLSCYLKAGNVAVGGIGDYDVSNTYASFNLTTGAVIANSAGVTASSKNAGNGWWRCAITFVQNTIPTGYSGIFVNNWNGGANGDTIYAFGAQQVLGNWAGPYVTTTTSVVNGTGAIRSLA
jgi:hypothetical protein